MKKICLLLSVCMLVCLAACQRDVEQPQKSESQTTTESTENKNGDDTDKMRVLTLEKSLDTHYEWSDDNDKALVRSEHEQVTLGQEDAKAFSEMAEVLSQISTMQKMLWRTSLII